ncbi:hypothetical protein JZ751_028142 [Albula glossodonta]|uniref:Uncharacterized protein n=1 Tax=Albula glossodonta TaxID=121402 RepID=A0A8T2PAT4_9TELE|nr:hypothetical protein JZ751_028142 [Albula glossodonta]
MKTKTKQDGNSTAAHLQIACEEEKNMTPEEARNYFRTINESRKFSINKLCCCGAVSTVDRAPDNNVIESPGDTCEKQKLESGMAWGRSRLEGTQHIQAHLRLALPLGELRRGTSSHPEIPTPHTPFPSLGSAAWQAGRTFTERMFSAVLSSPSIINVPLSVVAAVCSEVCLGPGRRESVNSSAMVPQPTQAGRKDLPVYGQWFFSSIYLRDAIFRHSLFHQGGTVLALLVLAGTAGFVAYQQDSNQQDPEDGEGVEEDKIEKGVVGADH